MEKKTLIILIVVLVISFFAGMKYEDYRIAHSIQRAFKGGMQQMFK